MCGIKDPEPPRCGENGLGYRVCCSDLTWEPNWLKECYPGLLPAFSSLFGRKEVEGVLAAAGLMVTDEFADGPDCGMMPRYCCDAFDVRILPLTFFSMSDRTDMVVMGRV